VTPLDVAQCGLTCRPAAVIMAGRGLMRPCAWGRWLPGWLPGISLATLIFEGRDPMRSPIASPATDLTRMSEPRLLPATAHAARTPGCGRWIR